MSQGEMKKSDFSNGDSLETENSYLKRRVEALQGLINDQFYSTMRFCLTLPFGGKGLVEQMLREVAVLHTKNSLSSSLFLDSHSIPPKGLSPKQALEFVIDIHIKEKLMERDWARIEDGEDSFTLYYSRENCFYLQHCEVLVCDGFHCQCVRRYFYEGIIQGMTGEAYKSYLLTPELEEAFCAFSFSKRHESKDEIKKIRESIVFTVEENSRLQDAVKTRTAQLEKQNKKLESEITERRLAEERTKASLKEKEVLCREIHHRVKNNMQIVSSLLRLQARNVKDEQFIEVFKESENRIKSMALIHEKLYHSKSLAIIDFRGYVEEMANGLFRAYRINTNKVALKVDVERISLEIDTAIPCGLIINELITNSLKYAFPSDRKGELLIHIRKVERAIGNGEWKMENESSQPATRNSQLSTRNSQPATRNAQPATRNAQRATRNAQPATRNAQRATRNSQLSTRNSQLETIELLVSDNGIGMPKDLDFQETKSLGLHLVNTLVRQIRGEIKLSREGGTEWKIRF